MLIRFCFNKKWRAWMRFFVVDGNLTLLFNVCPTKEIKIHNGLK